MPHPYYSRILAFTELQAISTYKEIFCFVKKSGLVQTQETITHSGELHGCIYSWKSNNYAQLIQGNPIKIISKPITGYMGRRYASIIYPYCLDNIHFFFIIHMYTCTGVQRSGSWRVQNYLRVIMYNQVHWKTAR